jgi:DNA repair exonuclease SbcCD ATPase subunit
METFNKNYTLFLMVLVATLLVSPVLGVHAQNTKDTVQIRSNNDPQTKRLREQMEEHEEKMEQKREMVREEVKNRVDALKADVEQRREEAKERLEEQREKMADRINESKDEARERIKHGMDISLNQIARRLLAAIDRAELLSGRIFSRIEKLKEEGVDTTEAETYLSTAKTEVEEAVSIVEKIPETITNVVNTGTIRDAFEEARSLILEAKNKIHDIYDNLREAIKILKDTLHLDTGPNIHSES